MDCHTCVSIVDISNHSLAIGIELDLYRSSYHKQMAMNNKDLHHIKQSHDILKEVYYNNQVNNYYPFISFLIIWPFYCKHIFPRWIEFVINFKRIIHLSTSKICSNSSKNLQGYLLCKVMDHNDILVIKY